MYEKPFFKPCLIFRIWRVQYPQWSLPSSPWSWPGKASLTPSIRRVGDFNVSNLMGIKRRIIDIGKKKLFNFFFAKCFKMYNFFAFVYKVSKSAIIYDPTIFCVKNINTGIKKRRIVCWFQIRWCLLEQMPLKKLQPKNLANFEYFRFRFSRGFCIYLF